jgi:spoIIIJ-associated protein
VEEAIVSAKKHLEDMLSFFGLNIDVYATHEEEVIQLSVPSTHLNGFLIGHNGENIRALQYLVSMALKAKGFEHSRVNVDIADYKAQRQERLAEVAADWLKEVKTTGQAKELQPMNAADRRVIHKLASDMGLSTESKGEGRGRYVVVMPPEQGSEPADEAAS